METIPSWLWWWTTFCGITSSIIGARKGRLILGFILGFLAGPIGIGIILLLKGNRRACPYCIERIHKSASACPHCQREILQSSYFESLGDQDRSRTAIIAVTLAVAMVIVGAVVWASIYNAGLSYSTKAQNYPSDVRPKISKLKSSDPERLDVTKPVFTTAGMLFTLNDKRPNTALWVSINIGTASVDKALLSWIALYGAKPGVISAPFQECKYMDAGIDLLDTATVCKVTIGARLKEADKIVYTAFDIPISELRASLLDAAK